MLPWIDLHSHWVPGIDDGARSPEEGIEMLRALRQLGFHEVVATPHMRPGLFDNDRQAITAAYTAMLPQVEQARAMPSVALSCEHYFDDCVYQRLQDSQGLPYPGAKAVLLEFYESAFPLQLDGLLATLSRAGLRPVIAHPERYRALWSNPERLESLLDAGAVALLDIAALAGKYGRRPERCAQKLLEHGAYIAACSDLHRPGDISAVAKGIRVVENRFGAEEVEQLLSFGPREILEGKVQGGA